VVGFNSEGRYTVLEIGPDGKIISDSRNIPIVTVAKTTPEKSETKINLDSVPASVKDAVKAYAGPADIRDVQLTTTKDGKTAFDIVFYRDGRRDEVILEKDGTVIDYKQNVAPAAEAASNKAPVIAVGDLPASVRETINRQTDGVTIKSIGTELIGNESVYKVSYQTNGAPVILYVGRDGAVVYPLGAPATPEASNAVPAPLPAKHPEVVRKVNANADKPIATAEAASAAGNAAPAEVVTVPPTRSTAKLTLADLPVPVQNTLKKLNGTSVIDNIAPKIRDSAVVYEVTYKRNGNSEKLLIGRDGVIMKEE
jgi:hypothetical protein